MGIDSRILSVLLSKTSFDVTLYSIETNVTLKSIDFSALSKILFKFLKKYDIINVQLDFQHVTLTFAKGNKRVYITIKMH